MNLFQLQQISDLKFRQSEQALTKLQSREATLRNELLRLQGLAHETNSQPASDAELRSIGGDIIWLRWLADSRRKLNIELAQVLAQKEALVARHRVANGKKIVTDALFDKQQASSKKEKADRALAKAIETSVARPSDQ
ncbi:hypothetical protein [uncultured Tateyamaria sp.]|uniref:hypothetical protein n=1 Tax=uncultured Tateyamaria sp. TaxID=455651 RepID=UPI00260620ED|nr:hypothetical protein [uncultured Tateyamaria sp.]